MLRSRRPATVLALSITVLAAAGCGGSEGGAPSRPAPSTTSAPSTTGSSTTLAAAASTVPPSSFGPPVVRGEIADERVTESSGLVASRRHPGRLWTHNDSDHPPLLFCLEPDGRSCGGWTVAGADNVDWEDVAAGPGPEPGEHYLYVGDIGDNTGSRDEVVVYRVVEPSVAADGSEVDGSTAAAVALRLRYEDGPHNSESLMVHPTTGDLYVATKTTGGAGVYRAPGTGGLLTLVATIPLGLVGLATGGDISPDGRRVALCTPLGGYELTLAGEPASGFDAIWSQPPVTVTLPGRTQGEAIAYRLDGDALLVTSEGRPAPLSEVPRV